MKTCSDCEESKPLSDFKVRKSGVVFAKCRACCYLDDVAWRNNNRDRYRTSQLKARYGISLEIYNKMLIDQNECCLGCKKHQSEFKLNMAVDHCHTTGKIRGLLCDGCNKAIGYMKDDPTIAENLAAYLRR